MLTRLLTPLTVVALGLAAVSCCTTCPHQKAVMDARQDAKVETDKEEKPGPKHVDPSPEQKQLAAQILRDAEAAQGTPGQEAANYLAADWVTHMIKQLAGERPATAGQLKKAETKVREFRQGIVKGLDWRRPEPVDVPKASSPIKLDGKLDEPAWKQALTFTNMYKFNTREEVAEPKTVWYVTWDEHRLYFGFQCEDPDIQSLDERDGDVWRKDCVEMFILPTFETRRYIELVVSPRGTTFDAVHLKHPDRFGANANVEADLDTVEIGASVRGTVNQSDDTDDGYTVEVAVPFAELPFSPARAKADAGTELHFMLCRLNVDTAKDGLAPYAHRPLLSWGHNIWNHGAMRLVK